MQGLWEDKRLELEKSLGLAKGGQHGIGEVFAEWMRLSAAVRSPRTIEIYGLMVRCYQAGVGDHRLADFGMLHVDRFVTWLAGQGATGETVNLRLRVLNTFLGWAVERELLAKKPRLKFMRTTRKLPKVLSAGEVEALFARLPTCAPPTSTAGSAGTTSCTSVS